MIVLESLNAEWLKSVSSSLGKVDVSLLEKAVRAYTMMEESGAAKVILPTRHKSVASESKENLVY